MLLITERRQIGEIFGHSVYAVSKSEIVALQNSTLQCNIANSRDENRFLRFLVLYFLFSSFLENYSSSLFSSEKKVQFFRRSMLSTF